MLALKYLPITCGLGMIFAAGCILTYDLYREMVYRRVLETPGGAASAEPVVVRWRTSLALDWPGDAGMGSAAGGLQHCGRAPTVPETLYPGAHMVTPLVENVAFFDTREQIFPLECRKMERVRRRIFPRRISFWMRRRKKV
jgi:hypothetical protein